MKWSTVLVLIVTGCAAIETGPPVRRVIPREVRARMEKGEPLLLVCAYDAKECRGTHLAGGITLEEFRERLDALPRDQEVVFYCG